MNTLPSDLVAAVRSAERIVVLTGAGVSAESGIPTFRDAMNGLWANFSPEDLATPEAFDRDPELVARWYDERRLKIATCSPNPGHVALAELQEKLLSNGQRLTLATQNVDRLHQAAGSIDVIELHGTLWVWRCTDCGTETEERGPGFSKSPPLCDCGGKKRPGVVWFGEPLPAHALLQAQRAAGSCQLFMTLGTSSVVYPAAGLIDLAVRNGASVLETNPIERPASGRATWSIRGTTGSILPHLLNAVFTQRSDRSSCEQF